MKWRPLQERIEAFSHPEPNSGCWLWTGALRRGYGSMGINRRSRRTHRVSYEVYKGPIPAGLCVLHKCDTPACVNPAHLFLGTHSDNIRDCGRKGRMWQQVDPSKIQGERAPAAKLTAAQVLAIREDRRSPTVIAAEFGVSRYSIYQIRWRETWAWLS